MKYTAKPSCAQELMQICFASAPLNVILRLYHRATYHRATKIFNLRLLFFGQIDGEMTGVGSSDYSIHKSSTLRWMMEIGGEKGMVFTKPIKDICRGRQHIPASSFRFKSIYRMLVRQSQRIDTPISEKQVVYALCDSGKTNFFSEEELDLLPLDALPSYIDCLGVP